MLRFIRQLAIWRGSPATIVLTLTLLLAACGGRFAFPGPEATTQPVAVAEGQFAPAITLSPPSGYAGIYVKVTGAGWPPNMMVVVVLTDPNGSSTTVASKDTDGAGNLTTGFLYPIGARWLLVGSYIVAAESADGAHQATAEFTVTEPGTDITPTAVATNVVAAAPTSTPPAVTPAASATATTANPTSTPVPAATAASQVTPRPRVTVASSPTPQATSVESASASSGQSPLIAAALVPLDNSNGSHKRYSIKIAMDANLRDAVAIILIPALAQVDDVKLKDKDKITIKVDRGKMEIDAPDPQLLLDFIQQHGGIEVQPGQIIGFKSSPDHKFRADYKDDTLELESSALLLQITAIDAAGVSHKVTVSLPSITEEEDHGDDDNDDNNGNDDSDDGDDDDD